MTWKRPRFRAALGVSRAAAAVLALAAVASPAASPEWLELFNGKDLTGWQHVGDGSMEVENGVIKTHGGMGLLYWTGGKIGNARIRVVYRMEHHDDNSSVSVRIPLEPREQWMPEQVRIDPFFYAGGAGAARYYRLDRAGRISRMPVALKQESRVTPLQVSAQFVCQRRDNRHVAIRLTFSMQNVNLWRIPVQKQILQADVNEFIHTGSGLEQRLDHQAEFALAAVGDLNQALDFTGF